jgi:signal transduction histidine kinase
MSVRLEDGPDKARVERKDDVAVLTGAMLKFRRYGMSLVLNCLLVYATLTLLVVGSYVVIVALLSRMSAAVASWAPLVATGVIALMFQPLRNKVQCGANRLLYGDRDNSYAVVSQLGRCLEQAVDSTEALPNIAEIVSEALQLPYVAIEVIGGEGQRLVAHHGQWVVEPDEFVITYQGQVVGRLLVSRRSPSHTLSTAECSLLQDLARQAGRAAHGMGLIADLQRSRERLVRSWEEERRRLRLELHDGLGPSLAGMTMQVGAARMLLTIDTAAAEGMLGELEQGLQTSTVTIRRLIDDLHHRAGW